MTVRNLGVLAAVLVMACVDYEGVIDPTHGLPDAVIAVPQFRRDIVPIFERRCAIGGCHSVATQQSGLTLTPDSAYDAIVNRPSRQSPGVMLVKPGSPQESWLAAVIGSDPLRRKGFPRMPLASGALTPNQVTTILNWIATGAPEN